MKRNKIRDLFLLSAVLLSLPCMADLQHTVTFDRNKLVLGEQQEETVWFIRPSGMKIFV